MASKVAHRALVVLGEIPSGRIDHKQSRCHCIVRRFTVRTPVTCAALPGGDVWELTDWKQQT